MRKLELLFSNEVTLEDLRQMRLNYSLIESISEDSEPYYGVNITKHIGDIVEADEVSGISNSRDNVISILKVLHKYEVTPISMVEIIDDLVTVGM